MHLMFDTPRDRKKNNDCMRLGVRQRDAKWFGIYLLGFFAL